METATQYTTFGLWTLDAILERSQKVRYVFPGIYFLIRDGTIVYVGQSSSNVLSRIAQHTIDKEFDSFTVIHLTSDVDLNELEASYIFQFEPHYNRGMPRNCRYLTKRSLKEALGLTGSELNRIIRERRIRPRFGFYYDIEEFK